MKSNHILLQLMLAVTATLFATVAGAAMYKWTDKEGNVHYTETPPDEGNIKEITPPPRVSPPPPKSANGAAKQESGGEEEALTPEQQEAYKRNCEAAKANMEIYRGSARVRQADGTVVELDEETRKKRIEQAEEQVKKFCKP